MPYIKAAEREDYDALVEEIARRIPLPAGLPKTGHLNYVFSRICASVLARCAWRGYHQMSAIRAALDDASAEWYRRVMAPYENEKAAENGDVY